MSEKRQVVSTRLREQDVKWLIETYGDVSVGLRTCVLMARALLRVRQRASLNRVEAQARRDGR